MCYPVRILGKTSVILLNLKSMSRSGLLPNSRRLGNRLVDPLLRIIRRLSTIEQGIVGPESESGEPTEDGIAVFAILSLTGKERACTLLSQIGEGLDETG